MMEYSLSLIPDDKLSQRIVKLSQELNLQFGKFQPHITLLWLEASDVQYSSVSLKLQVRQLYIDRDEKGRVWYGLVVQKTRAITQLLNVNANASGYDVDTDNYFPHITLGCGQFDSLSSVRLQSFSEISPFNESYNFTLKLCRNGDFGKVVEILR